MCCSMAVPGCENHGYHRLPKDEIRRALGIKAIQHGNRSIKISLSSRLCSAHFQVADFSVTPSYWHNYRKYFLPTDWDLLDPVPFVDCYVGR